MDLRAVAGECELAQQHVHQALGRSSSKTAVFEMGLKSLAEFVGIRLDKTHSVLTTSFTTSFSRCCCLLPLVNLTLLLPSRCV